MTSSALRSSASKPKVEVSVSYGLPHQGLPDEDQFQLWAAAALDGYGVNAEVSIRVVDAVEGQALNLKYRHKDYPTNVLSFKAELPPGLKIPLLGDVVLCGPVVAKEATDQGKTLQEHYAHLTVHGVLHLIGHDHETIAEARRMEALEVQVLEQLGIPDPYQMR